MSLLKNIFGKEENKGGKFNRIIELAKPALNLTPDQDQKITDVLKNFREEKQGLKSGGGDNMRDDMHTARHEAMQKIKDVLNEDQKRIFEENISKWRDEVK